MSSLWHDCALFVNRRLRRSTPDPIHNDHARNTFGGEPFPVQRRPKPVGHAARTRFPAATFLSIRLQVLRPQAASRTTRAPSTSWHYGRSGQAMQEKTRGHELFFSGVSAGVGWSDKPDTCTSSVANSGAGRGFGAGDPSLALRALIRAALLKSSGTGGQSTMNSLILPIASHSIWRTRSRVRLILTPISLSVRGSPPSRP